MHPAPDRRSTGRLALVSAAVVAATAVLNGCAKPAPPAARQAPPVTVAAPDVETVTEYLYYEGNLESAERAEIRARVAGFLEEVLFDESTLVTAGQPLFVIEPRPYEVAVDQASAAVARAEAEVSASRARRDRVKDAFTANVATELELIEAEADLAVREAAVAEAKAQLDDAELRLSYTRVISPISGRIDRNYVDAGNLVGDGERTLLAEIVRSDEVFVSFEASEAIVLRYVNRGDSGEVGARDADPPPVEIARVEDTGWPFAGVVDFIDNVVDRETGTLGIRARIPNPDRVLVPGFFVRIRVPFQELPDALLVPESAVQTDLAGRFVLTVDEGNLVERVGVEVGARYGDRRHIVSGLAPDSRVIVNGIQRARPGLAVTAMPAGAGAGAGGGAAGGGMPAAAADASGEAPESAGD